jgi:hypothetical protein
MNLLIHVKILSLQSTRQNDQKVQQRSIDSFDIKYSIEVVFPHFQQLSLLLCQNKMRAILFCSSFLALKFKHLNHL